MHQVIIDLDESFKKLSTAPLIANDFNLWTDEGKKSFLSMLVTQYEGDFSSPVPRCRCGNLTSGRNYGMYCDKCHTKCVDEVERDVEATMWVRPPMGVHRFIHPAIWKILQTFLSVRSTSMLHYMTDRYYRVPETTPWLEKYKAAGLPRGLNAFYENFDAMMDFAIKNAPLRRLVQREELRSFLHRYRNQVFCQHLPIPNPVAFILEKNDHGNFGDEKMSVAINAVFDVVLADGRRDGELVSRPYSVGRKEAAAVSAMDELTEYYTYFVSKIGGEKEGIWRQHIFGTMLHWTARAVITSISKAHDYRECHLPWSLSVQLFKAHLLSKLLRGGQKHDAMSYNAAYRRLNWAVNNYDPLIDELMKELIVECPYMGIPIILQRNPSLARGSAQLLYVTQVIPEPHCNAIRMSVLDLKAPNADLT